MPTLDDLLLRAGWRPPRDGARGEARDAAHPAINDLGYEAPQLRFFRIPLGDVYENKRFEVEGTFLWCVKSMPNGAYCRISFNEQDHNGGIPFSEGMQISGLPFSRIWVTNPVHQGKTTDNDAPFYLEMAASRLPIETKQPAINRGEVCYGTHLQYTSANNATPVGLTLENSMAGFLYDLTPFGAINLPSRMYGFETWLQNDPIDSTDRLHYAISSKEWFDALGMHVSTLSPLIDIGETVIFPYVPQRLEILSANAATAATGIVSVIYRWAK